MFERLARSWELVKQSWKVLLADKELIVFPILSGIAALIIAASFLAPLWGDVSSGRQLEGNPKVYALVFLFYVTTYFAMYYFNVAVMWCAAIRMDGGDPTVADGFRGATRHALKILVWAVFSATVGLLIKGLEERAGILGRIVLAILGCAWAAMTYFAIPVLIFEPVGVGANIKRSATLLKETWGEGAAGHFGIGAVFSWLSLLGILPIAVAIMSFMNGVPSVGVLFISMAMAYWVALAIVGSALNSIFQVALYRYATNKTSQASFAFSDDVLRGHFVKSSRWS